ncbi:hypothetical protein niasHS_011442 [Heterodera schachtii]|uniref:RING-type domain-containing protein n=1 Tax=Heterodera schachtii TaxID=97005 RepID=A0ABD2INB9_HETSC
MNNIEFIAFAFLALFEFGLAQPKPTPENDNVQPLTSETDSSAQVQNPLDIAHPIIDENQASGEAPTALFSGPSAPGRAGENTPKNGENSQSSKDPAPENRVQKATGKMNYAEILPNFINFRNEKTAISYAAKGKNIENTQSSMDPASKAHKELAKEKNAENAQPKDSTSEDGQNEAIPSPKKPSPRRKSKSDFGLNLAKAFPRPVPKGKNVENTQSSTDSASEAHKELAKEKNEQNAQTSKDPPTSAGGQNEAIPSPKKQSPKGKSKSDFGRNLAKAFPRPVPKAKVGEKAQSSTDPTINGQFCAICLDSSLITDLELSECHHRFHRECVDGWFKNNDTCPTCRNVVASRYLPRPTRTDRIFDSRIETKRRFMDNHFGNNFTVEITEEGAIQLSKNDRK